VVTFPFGTPITLVKRAKAAPDALGNDTWTTTDVVTSGAFNPGSSAELVQGQDLLTQQPTVYLPPDVDLTAVDAVVVYGEQFEVDGAPKRWVNPFTGWNPGVEVKLKRVTG
jgi:hypothetical protein